MTSAEADLQSRLRAVEEENARLRARLQAGSCSGDAGSTVDSRAHRIQAIIESAVDIAIIGTDRDGRVREWNPGAARIFGWSAQEMLGESLERIFTAEDREAQALSCEMRSARDTGRAVDERWHQAKDGRRFWASGEMMPLQHGGGTDLGFVKILRDRTEAHLAGAALRESEARLRRAQEAGGVGIFWVGMDDDMLHASPEFCRLFGVPERERFPAHVVEQLVVPEDAGLVSTAASRQRGEAPSDTEYRIRRGDDGEQRWISRRGELEYDASGRPIRFVGVARDITDQMRARRELEDQREQLAQMFEQAPTFMVLLRGKEHHIERVNPGFVRLIGGRDVVGRTMAEALPDMAEQGFLARLDDVYATGRTYAATAAPYAVQAGSDALPSVRYVDFVFQPIRDASGAVSGIFIEGVDVTDRATAGAALHDTQERLEFVLDAVELGVWDLDLTTDVTVRSPRHDRMFGYEDLQPRWSQEIAERHLLDEDKPLLRTAMRIALKTARLAVEARVRWPDDTVHWISVQGRTYYDEGGRPVRMAGIVADVTDGKHAEAALAASEQRYRTLFDSMDEGFCIIEFIDGPHGPLSDYIHIEANAAYAKHAGIPDVVGQKLREMVPDEADGWLELYGGVLHTGAPIRFERELVATGRYLELAAFRIEPASRREVAVLFQDITPRKRAERALQELNETLEARVVEALAERNVLADIVEGTNAFVQVVDPQYRWLAINGAASREFQRIYGVLPKIGDNMLDILAHLPDHREAVRAVWTRALGGEEFIEVAAFGDPERDRRHYEMRFSTLRDAAGRQIGAYQFVYDVTERLAGQDRLRKTEEALRQSQKMEAVGQLTGGIAHDFNNLLTGITGSLELLQVRLSQGRLTEIDRYVTAAQGASKRAAALTHRLLAFSRRQTLDPKPTDVNRLVIGMDELLRRTIGPQVTLEVVTACGLWPTLIDPPQLENALLNLCINARDAMPEGGRITIETANKWLDLRSARERDLPPGQYISLCVTDTGVGMTPDVIAKAFDPFFTTKPIGQGTGLGLSMIYGFVRQSGGQVRIYSEVGKGTTMCLYLPRHHAHEGDVDALAEIGETPRAMHGETVLVVDDEPTVRMLVTEVLEDLGYTALEAADGPSGLKVLQSDVRIDLLVTDVGLPGGMNGRQMADAARERRPELKVLFITGYAENAIIGNGHLAPGMQVMTKPFAVEVLASRIREMIET